jgi:starch synthase
MRVVQVAYRPPGIAEGDGAFERASGLARGLARRGERVVLFVPEWELGRLGCVELRGEVLCWEPPWDVPGPVVLRRGELSGGPEVVVVGGAGLEGAAADGAEAVFAYDRAVVHALLTWELWGGVVHTHDAPVGLVHALLRTRRPLEAGRTILVQGVHRPLEQGIYPRCVYERSGLDWLEFHPGGVEFYGKMNLLKAGLVYGDAICVASQRMLEELQQPSGGHGLEGVYRQRREVMHALLPGWELPLEELDPPPSRWGARGAEVRRAKAGFKEALAVELGWSPEAVRARPLVVYCGGLSDAAAARVICRVLPDLLRLDVHLVLLPQGEIEDHFRVAAARVIRRAGGRGVWLGELDDAAFLRVLAAADLAIFPAAAGWRGRELAAALALGAVPVVGGSGLQHDLVRDPEESPGGGYGFRYREYAPYDLLVALMRAFEQYHAAGSWEGLLERARAVRTGADRAAEAHQTWYKELKAARDARSGKESKMNGDGNP